LNARLARFARWLEARSHVPYAGIVNRAEAIRRLSDVLPELRQRFGVRSLILFGSTARGDAHPDSDVDVLVDLGPAPTYRRLLEVIDALEAKLQVKVDVVTPGAVRPRLLRHIAADGVRVA